MKNKTTIIAASITLFAIVAIFVGLTAHASRAQACATECYPPLTGYCVADVSEAEIGERVSYTVHPDGGTEEYAYTWTGTDGLQGETPTVSKSYSTSGTKTARVQITSNGQNIYKTCTVVIKSHTPPPPPPCSTCTCNNSCPPPCSTCTCTDSCPPPPCSHSCYPPLTGYCVADVSEAEIGERVSYTVHPDGGTEEYAYTWTGTDGLQGETPTVSKSYSTSGTKTARVQITSNGQNIYKTCTVVITKKVVDNNLGGYCEGRPSNADEDEKVTWTAYPTGGNGNFRYDWSGTDGLGGTSKSISKRYDNDGTKQARVTITSNGRSVTKSCDVEVESPKVNLDAYCVASDSSVDINRSVTFTAYPSANNRSNSNNSFRYDWSGTDGLNGSGKSVSKSYGTDGSKSAKVTITVRNGSTSDKVTATCKTNVIGPSVIYTPPSNPPRGGVYLDTIPATGISANMKTSLFLVGTLAWSAFLGYIFILRRNLKLKEQKMIEEAIQG